MKSLTKNIIGIASLALVVPFVIPLTAQAAEKPKPSNSVCSESTANKDYACMEVNANKVPSGDPATFTGTLSTKARKALASWTNGDNIVCLARYKTTPETDGWPSQSLDSACTTVRNNGGFTIVAEFGRKGTYYYGLEMGPCRSKDTAECGSSDPGLIGLYNKNGKALALKTS
jgi:hypothetical protein